MKKNFDEIRIAFKERGYELLSEPSEYENVHSLLRYMCPKHKEKGELKIKWMNFNKGAGCYDCGVDTYRKDYKDVKKAFDDKGLVLLDTEYINIHQKMECVCPKHPNNKFFISYNNIKSSKGCPDCNKRKRSRNSFSFEKIKESFLDNGLVVKEGQEKIYKNTMSIVEATCIEHPEETVFVSYNKVNRRKYPCSKCKKERHPETLKLTFTEVNERFQNIGLILEEGQNYRGCDKPLKFRCVSHPDKVQMKSYRDVRHRTYPCDYCYDEIRRGDTSPNWKGGRSEVQKFVRWNLREWKKDVLAKDNGKCVITGDLADKTFPVHHLLSAKTIFEDVVKEVNFEIKESISKHTEEELEILSNIFSQKHSVHLGVVLRPDIHKLFHRIYGYKNNTPQQFEEFKEIFNHISVDNALYNMKIQDNIA